MDGYITIGTKVDTKDFTAQINKMESKLQDLQFQYDAISKAQPYSGQSKDLQDISAEISKTNNGLIDMRAKQDSINKTGFNNIKNSIDNVKESIQKTIKTVLKWSLAVFGIRSAYLAVKKAASTLSQYNKQISDDLQYIQYAMATAIQPIVEWLIQGAYKLLSYVNSIAEAWFGVNLFANASADKMNKGAKATEKQNKELKKTLASFDEINQLQSDTSSKSSKDTGIVTPSFDLSKMQGEVPAWLQWIIDNGPTVIGILGGIAGAIVAINLGASGIKALGIGVLIYGIISLVGDLIQYLKDPSFENFSKIITDIGFVLLGLGIIIGGIPLIIAGAIVIIIGLITQNWEKIKEFFGNIIQWITDKINNLNQWFFDNMENIKRNWGLVGLAIVGIVVGIFNWIGEIIKESIQVFIDIFEGLFRGVKQILDGIIMIFRGDFKEGLISIAIGIGNILIGILNGLIDGINAIMYPIRALISGLGKIMGKSWSIGDIKIPTIHYLATGGIVDVPKTGVGIGNARVGEAGAEGVLPLTNPETMAKLGQEIGKWITINMNLTNTLDGRVLNNRLEQIKNQNNFSRNGA